jgi:hypothetical protein
MLSSTVHRKRIVTFRVRPPMLLCTYVSCLRPDLPSRLSLHIFRCVRKISKKWLLVSSCLSVRLSAWSNSAPIGRIFMKFFIWSFFENPLRQFKFHRYPTGITGSLHDDLCTFITPSSWVILIMRNVSDKTCVENYNTHFMCHSLFPKMVPFMR